MACSGEGGFWVSFGPHLYRWHEEAWHHATTRGTSGNGRFFSVGMHGTEVVAMQGGDVWRGDADMLRPIGLVSEPRSTWYEGPILYIEDAARGCLMRFRGDQSEGAALEMPEEKGKRAVVKSFGPHGLAAAGARLWQRASEGWREIETVPLWQAVGTEQLQWEDDPDGCWLPLPPPAPPSIHDVVRAVLDGLSVSSMTWAAHPALVVALENSDKRTVLWLLGRGAAPSLPPRARVGDEERDTVSPLAYAAWNGDLWAVKKMLAREPDLEGTMHGCTALAQAIEYGHDDIVELLLEHGVPIRARHDHATPPVRMLLGKSLEWLERFEEDLRDDIAGAGGIDALEGMFLGHKSGDKQQEIDWLLERGARPTTSRAFRWAIDAGQLRAVELALEAGIDPDLSETLSFVMRRAPIPSEVVRLLLVHGADPDAGDHGALYWAVRADDEVVAAVLLKGGADPTRKHYDSDNLRADPLTALDHARRRGSPKTTALLSEGRGEASSSAC